MNGLAISKCKYVKSLTSYSADEVNLLAYQETHRVIHMAWTFAHPRKTGFNIVHNACVNIFIPIAPLQK